MSREQVPEKTAREWVLERSLMNWSSKQILDEWENANSQVITSSLDDKEADAKLSQAMARWQDLASKGYWYVSFFDDNYPFLLKQIQNPPAILYGIGDKSVLNDFSLAIVGSRNASDYGLYATEIMSRELSLAGVRIVSGLAIGIDALAHEACLKSGGKTVGVLGCGIDIIYPKRNLSLARKMIGAGCIITEYPPGSPPLGYHFHERNRILSGLARGVVVVEANRKSGTMITTRFAGEQGRDVFAVPGNINQPRSQGTNELIQLGAKLIMDVSDIACEFTDWPKRVKKQDKSLYSKKETILFGLLETGPKSFQELVDGSKMSINDLWATITGLEMQGLLIENNHGKYVWIRK